MKLLRPGVLAERSVIVAGDARPELSHALLALGARVEPFVAGAADSPGDWARVRAPIHALVFDGTAAFGDGGQPGLAALLEQTWAAVLEVATAMIEAGTHGKLVLVAPPPDAGPLAGAAAAGLENLARTLSVEWARHGVTAVAVLPGPATPGDELSTLVGFLVSPAGHYFSGCRLELGHLRR